MASTAPRPSASPRIAIIGGGYAGMAAAVALVDAGAQVCVFEASRLLGGRARRLVLNGVTVDNGQHILVGAYRETLNLMRHVGVPETALLRLPLHLEIPGEMRLRAPDWPAPLHLAAALLRPNGLSWREKWAAIRLMQGLKACRYQLTGDQPVAAWLKQADQPARLIRLLWEPLCVATLNTPLETASAQVFAHVLRDTLGASDKSAAELLIPRVDLSALLPEAAAAHVAARGGQIVLGQRITDLQSTPTGWRLTIAADSDTEAPLNSALSFDQVIIATAPYHAQRLLQPLDRAQLAHPEATETAATLSQTLAQLAGLHHEPIVTAWMQYPTSVRLPMPMLGWSQSYLQWLFDRGALGGPAGLMGAVISARGQHQGLDSAALLAALDQEIRQRLPDLPALQWGRVITEQRATFACTPNLPRPGHACGPKGLWLAGDYTASDYPATLESAVRSGQGAAAAALAAMATSAALAT